MASLKASIRSCDQQMPIEVVALGNGRYGLISGARRLAALSALHAETGEARFATVKALLRPIKAAPKSYLAMVEENEIRATCLSTNAAAWPMMQPGWGSSKLRPPR